VKIVITGAAGFIGSHLCEELIRRGHQVVGIDSFDDYLYPAERKRHNAAALTTALAGQRFELVEANICDHAAMARACAGAHVVCHLAALAGVRPSLAEPARYARTNVEGTVAVYEACRTAGVNRVVFASSSSVYGARSDQAAFREDDPCLRPASPYGASKRCGELLSSTYCDLYGLGIAALRFFTVYGPRQRPDMAIYKFVHAAATGAPVTLFGDGSSRRDYTFIDDIVAGTAAACERVEPGGLRIYNLGGTRTTSLGELVQAVERVTGRPLTVHRADDQPGDVPLTYADVSRARAELGYAPSTDLAAGLARFWAWYQSDGRPMP
jgi:UDP-glucuronate 4-epimerase